MKKNSPKEKVLIHACCAICAGHPIQLLKEKGYEPIAYFFNPNVYPENEFMLRQKAMETLCKKLKCELIIDNNRQELYNEIMVGYENHGEGSDRCTRCFELRMLQTAFKAQELNISNFTTSLTSSPHKKFETIQSIGNCFSKYFGIRFLDYNFKKQDGFLKTLKIANSLNLHRQNYCGCINSMGRLKSPEAVNNVTLPWV